MPDKHGETIENQGGKVVRTAAQTAVIMAVCVLTGEATVDEIERENIKPTLTFNSVMDIYRSVTFNWV